MYWVAILCLLSAAAALPTQEDEQANLPDLPESSEENGSKAAAHTLEESEEMEPHNFGQSSRESEENKRQKNPEEFNQSEESNNSEGSNNSEDSKERNHEQRDSKEDQGNENFDKNKEPGQGQVPTKPVVVQVEDKIKPGLLHWLQTHFNFFPFNALGKRGRSALGKEQIYIVAVVPDVGVRGKHQH